ncbi:MAG: glycine betaine ABC transporter substrate-binding protein [Microcystaceae cyanobacterium]
MSFLDRYGSEILLRTGEHLLLVFIAMMIAIFIAIPMGILITRKPKLAKFILGLANGIQTLPSLAIFGFLITVPLVGGIGKIPAIVALILYGLLPIIRNTYTGIRQIDRGVIEAGLSLGLTPRQILVNIELPLALEIILAGIRTATVICVGIGTIAAAIGGGGLGVFIFQGIATVNNQLILAGAIPSAIIALGADWGIGWLERQSKKQSIMRSHRSRKITFIPFLITGFILFSCLGVLHQTFSNSSQSVITIGSKNFTEQVILGEMLSQMIEENTDLTVERKFYLGGTFICHEAVKAGQIAGYVEYTGTALTAILNQEPINNAQQVYRIVQDNYQNQFNLKVFPSLGFENTFAIIIRQSDADKYQLINLSDAAKYAPQWIAGFGHEFIEREDGYRGLATTYGLEFATFPKTMEIGLMYKALVEKQVDLVAGSSTDGLIPVLNLTILKDDKQYFPPYEAVPIFNQEILSKYPQLSPVINQLNSKISAEEMQKLNYQVDNQSQTVEDVVQDFLQSKSLI